MNRRQAALMAGVAAGSTAAGAGLWWLRRPAAPPTVPAELWTLRFEQPGGQSLDMARALGGPLLLNFWASWCPPCIKEMPLLDEFYRQQHRNGWRVIGLAADQADAVRDHLARHPVSFPIGLAGLEGIALSRQLGNPHGALPFTVIFNRQGQPVDTKIGAINPDDLARWAQTGGARP